jgi:hypothetical protein
MERPISPGISHPFHRKVIEDLRIFNGIKD